jgi:hypothetical protein
VFDPNSFQHIITLTKIYSVEIAGTIVFLALLCKVVWRELKSIFVNDPVRPSKPGDS